mmetsp:Transcript_17781/g.44214  ORF Transcript_17781/g.44214 Transcript_17781/m.44214 type:complete len:241 (-) Transcript_17781:108-830(-)
MAAQSGGEAFARTSSDETPSPMNGSHANADASTAGSSGCAPAAAAGSEGPAAEAAAAAAKEAGTPEEAQPDKPDAADMDSGRARGGGSLMCTGKLGDVMLESSKIAHTLARRYARTVQPKSSFLERAVLHMHVPEGSTPKDGPSAGAAMVTSLLSLALGKPVRQHLAMTGEVSLTGLVLPIGGVKEKVIAAQRAGVKHIILPSANQRDWVELPDNLREGLEIHFVSTYDDVYQIALNYES